MQIRPVLHVSLLEHAAEDPYPGQLAPPPSAVIVDVEEEWEVETILDSREPWGINKSMMLLCVPDSV